MTDCRPSSLRLHNNDQAVENLARYYSKTQPYTGATFDVWRSPHCAESADDFTADDLVAVTFLSVSIPPVAAQRVLIDASSTFTNLLARIPRHVSFWEAGEPSADSPQWQLEKELLAIPGVGLAKASKLMARKRPALVPILDSVVREELGLHRGWWAPLYDLFSDVDFRSRLEAVRDEAEAREDVTLPGNLSLLRVFDVVTWMDGKATASSHPGPEGWPDGPARDED